MICLIHVDFSTAFLQSLVPSIKLLKRLRIVLADITKSSAYSIPHSNMERQFLVASSINI